MEKIDRSRFKEAIDALPKTNVLVIGDLILDEYLFGQVSRISPEAPVPVVWIRKEETTLGGAGNVVKNLHTLGASIQVIGRCGIDEKGSHLKKLLSEEGILEKDIFLLQSESIPTILKTRILAGHQQVCRVDREENLPLNPKEEDALFAVVQKFIKEASAIILSDYDKGLLSGVLIQRILEECTRQGKIVTVDPQVNHFFQYKNISIMTPNHHEAGKAIGKVLDSDQTIESAFSEIAKSLNPTALMITRGEKGMSVYLSRDKSIHHIPTVAREVFDVTGAGDTVISVYTAFHAAGLNEVEAAIVANAAAGVVVAKLGAATATIEEIQEKLLELEMLQ